MLPREQKAKISAWFGHDGAHLLCMPLWFVLKSIYIGYES